MLRTALRWRSDFIEEGGLLDWSGDQSSFSFIGKGNTEMIKGTS